MAGYKPDPTQLVQVASADTVISRKATFDADLLVVDEAHLAVNGAFKKVVQNFKGFIVAVTATPYTKEPLTHLAQAIVNPITTIELIKKGYLVNAKYYAPSIPDLKGVKSRAGDYSIEDLQERMAPLTGDIVKHWKTLGQNRPTLCFAVNIQHSQSITRAFNDAGIPAIHLEANNSLEERQLAVDKLGTGELKIISNVGVMCTGVDIPFLSCLIMARPTKSYTLFIQQAGRGTRPYENKKDFLILDHAGNSIRHGFITEEQDVSLTGQVKNKTPALKQCKECYLVFQGVTCPACGWDSSPPAKKATNYEVDNEGSLVEITEDFALNYEISLYIKRNKLIQINRGYKKSWLYHTVKNKYGEAIAARAFPKLHARAQYISRKHSSSFR